MAALFSIVQDEHPPLPNGISTSIKEFLLLCFQKDPAMRSTAAVLLSHPWLQQVPQINTTPRTSTSPPIERSFSTPIVYSPKRRQSIRDTKQDTVSRCASAESSPTLADRSSRHSDHAYFSEIIISPRYVLDAAVAERDAQKQSSISNVPDSSRSSNPPNGIERSLLLREANLLRTDRAESRIASCAKEAAIALNSVSVDGLGPLVDEVSVRRSSSGRSNSTSDFSRMMSFELPYEKESASGWSSCESVGVGSAWDVGLGLGPTPIVYGRTESGKLGGFSGVVSSLSSFPPMLSIKQVSSMTASCSSFMMPGFVSSPPSSSNNSIAGPDADALDNNGGGNRQVITRTVLSELDIPSAALPILKPIVTDELVDDNSTGAFDDSDDMRLSLDDEVDERRGLNILRKSLKSASFLDIDRESSPVWSENEEDIPRLTLSLKKPEDYEGGKDFRRTYSNSFADELRVRMSLANSRSISSFDGNDDYSLVRSIQHFLIPYAPSYRFLACIVVISSFRDTYTYSIPMDSLI